MRFAADAGCTSAGRGVGGTFYARRHTFTLDAAARVSVDLVGAVSDAGRLDVYAVVYRGHDAVAGAVVGRDDNSGPRSDSRLRSLRLGAGEYTIEATTAECTAAPAAASVAAGRGRRRTVSATLDGPGSLPVTVICTAAGRGPARQQAVLTHAGALSSIAARIVGSGGECRTAAARRGVDVAYRCRIGRGNTVTVAADAVATGPGVEVAWDTTGAVTATGHQTDAATPTFGPDNSIAAWKRTAMVDLACTANGATRGCRLTLSVDHDVRAPDQPARTLVTVGQQISCSWMLTSHSRGGCCDGADVGVVQPLPTPTASNRPDWPALHETDWPFTYISTYIQIVSLYVKHTMTYLNINLYLRFVEEIFSGTRRQSGAISSQPCLLMSSFDGLFGPAEHRHICGFVH